MDTPGLPHAFGVAVPNIVMKNTSNLRPPTSVITAGLDPLNREFITRPDIHIEGKDFLLIRHMYIVPGHR